MGHMIELKAADGHTLGAYEAGPPDAASGLVVVQEIFGVNHHMRTVCDRFAEAGYHVIAPALFDRAQRGVELGYGEADRRRGIELRAQVPEEGTLADVKRGGRGVGAPQARHRRLLLGRHGCVVGRHPYPPFRRGLRLVWRRDCRFAGSDGALPGAAAFRRRGSWHSTSGCGGNPSLPTSGRNLRLSWRRAWIWLR